MQFSGYLLDARDSHTKFPKPVLNEVVFSGLQYSPSNNVTHSPARQQTSMPGGYLSFRAIDSPEYVWEEQVQGLSVS